MPSNGLRLRDFGTLLLFVAALFAADRLISSCLGGLLLRSNLRFSLVYKGGLNSDILLMGNSRAVDSLYGPDIEKATGRRVFQLGYQGMSTSLSEVLLKDYYERNKPPRLLVLEVTSLTTSDDLIDDIRAYAWLSPRLRGYFKQADEKGFFFAELSNLYYFNGEVFIKSLFCLNRPDPYRMGLREVTDDMLKVTTRQTWQSKAENLAAMRRIVKFATRQGTEVRLLIAPVHPKVYREVTNLRDWIGEIQDCVGPGVKIWNYLDSISNQKAFGDPYHLNYKGSQLLLADLKKDGFFRCTAGEIGP